MLVGILFVQAVAFAVLSGIVASNKNRDTIGWGVLGFLFGLFAFIAALIVEEVEPEGGNPEENQRSKQGSRQSSKIRRFDPDDHEKKCPDCAEYIKLEARVCRYCGHEFSKREVEKKVDEVKQEWEHSATNTQSHRQAKRVPESDEKPTSATASSDTEPSPDTPDTYSPDTSRSERWVVTLVVLGGIILIIVTIATLQAG